ncbi:MAG: preprotein translocase subunit YajC [Chloroflexi bacterium RBG_16_51_9]|nr:MAG: preprotein translocase subunit YajC [Chloroflexi bacterium RBG_16_51_9]
MNPFLFLVLMVGGFMLLIYFLMIRPMTKREKQHDTMVEELQTGDTIITAGGMYGTVETIDKDSVVLKVESGALIRVTKGGVLKRDLWQQADDWRPDSQL